MILKSISMTIDQIEDCLVGMKPNKNEIILFSRIFLIDLENLI
jgi:hypothetical protein